MLSVNQRTQNIISQIKKMNSKNLYRRLEMLEEYEHSPEFTDLDRETLAIIRTEIKKRAGR